MEKVGISNLKKAVKFGIDLGEQFAEALKDGKIVWTESFGFIDELLQVPALLKSGQDCTLELKDLDAEERAELYAYVQDEFDIDNEKVEAEVEAALKLAVDAVALVEMIKQRKAA